MKAAVQKAINVVEVADVAEPAVKLDQIKVKVAFAGICGTDMEILEGRFGLFKAPRFPKIEGHEVPGAIVEIGSACRLAGGRESMLSLRAGGRCAVRPVLINPIRAGEHASQGPGGFGGVTGIGERSRAQGECVKRQRVRGVSNVV